MTSIQVDNIANYFIFVFSYEKRNEPMLCYFSLFNVFYLPNTIWKKMPLYLSCNLSTIVLKTIFLILPLSIVRSHTLLLMVHLVLKILCLWAFFSFFHMYDKFYVMSDTASSGCVDFSSSSISSLSLYSLSLSSSLSSTWVAKLTDWYLHLRH